MQSQPPASANIDLKTKPVPRWLIFGAPIAALASLCTVLVFYFLNFNGGFADQATFGQFGDFVGGILNPIFAFLAFLLLLWTLVLQTREFQLSTGELKRSAEALAAQNKSILLQSFESTFFQMLRRIDDVVEQARFTGNSGRNALRYLFLEAFRESCRHQSLLLDRKALVENAYEAFYTEWRHMLGHYFRSLYHIFTFIDRSHLSDDEKSKYANVVRAQLTPGELSLLFYNGTWGEGKVGFRPLIEKYGILKHIHDTDLQKPDDRLVFYSPTAFMGREDRLRWASAAKCS